jgi:small subunit ribosomal protein S4
MGKPKFSRKKYETPSHPWKADRIKDENELSRKYGLKNKREIWKAQTALKRYRGQARELLAKIDGDNPQVKKESEQLLMSLTRMNILPLNSTLDDVLALETEPILSRRLQTITYLKGLANTPLQARQLISHGHIAIADRRITVPSYMVKKDEESKIGYTVNSPLNALLHPARPSAEIKSIPIKKEDKTEESEDKSIREKPTKTDEAKKDIVEEKPAEKENFQKKKSVESKPKGKPAGTPEGIPPKTEKKASADLSQKEKSTDSEKQIIKSEESKDESKEEKSEDKNKSVDVKEGGK